MEIKTWSNESMKRRVSFSSKIKQLKETLTKLIALKKYSAKNNLKQALLIKIYKL